MQAVHRVGSKGRSGPRGSRAKQWDYLTFPCVPPDGVPSISELLWESTRLNRGASTASVGGSLSGFAIATVAAQSLVVRVWVMLIALLLWRGSDEPIAPSARFCL